MSTLTHLSRLSPYALSKEAQPVDQPALAALTALVPDAVPHIMKYSRGMYSLELHYESLKRYDQPLADHDAFRRSLANDITMHQALRTVKKELTPFFSVTAISASALDNVPYVSSSVAGFGYIGSKADNYLLARSRATANLANFRKLGSTLKHTPSLAFARCQLAPLTDPKVRHVWACPFHQILLEGCIAAPILNNLAKNATPLAIGLNPFKDLPTELSNTLEINGYVACLDYSAFDSTINTWWIEQFFKFIKDTVKFPNNFTAALPDYCLDALTHTPILMPDGHLWLCKSGLPSGSYFTSLIGSFVNLTLCRYIQLKLYKRPTATSVLGDDSVFATPMPLDLDLAQNLIQKFGFKLNSKKSLVTNSLPAVVYLGHNVRGSSLTRPEWKALLLAMLPEQTVTDPSESLLRLLSINIDCGLTSNILVKMINQIIENNPNVAIPPGFGTPPHFAQSFTYM